MTIESRTDLSATVDATRMPIVREIDGEIMADSRDVAAFFGKRHEDVLRAIRSLSCSSDFTRRNFAFREEIQRHSTGASKATFAQMTKDGFAFLVMGFTGGKAAQFKEAYIAQFNAMESEIRQRGSTFSHMIPQDLPSALRLAADQMERAKKAEAALEEAKPKVVFHDRVGEAVNSQSVEEVAKMLGTGRNRMFKWLRDQKILMPNNLPYQRYIDAGYFKPVEKSRPGKHGESYNYTQTLVTGRGLQYIQRRWDADPETERQQLLGLDPVGDPVAGVVLRYLNGGGPAR